MLAVYISATQFRVNDDLTGDFPAGRRIKADCGVDGIKYSTVQSSSYSNPNTTITITESVLTSNLTDVLYGIINTGAEGSLPEHSHDGTEGHGGQIDASDLLNKTFIDLDDTPAAFVNGKYLRSSTNGIDFVDIPPATTFSGTEVFVDGDATVTGTIYAHVYDSYSPLTIKDGGVNVIVGNGMGNIDFPNGITVSGSPAVGPTGPQGIIGPEGTGWIHGTGVPSAVLGKTFDYYLDDSTYDIYNKNIGTYTSNLFTDQNACSADLANTTAKNVLIGGVMWSVYDPAFRPSWEYDFGEDFNQVIVRIVLQQGYGSGYYFDDGQILGSNDRENYTLLHSFFGPKTSSLTSTFDFVNSTVYRYIKIKNTSTGNTGITTLEAYAFATVDWQQFGNIKGADGATSSGTTSSGGATTFLELTDTPSTYSGTTGQYLTSTGSGILWTSISGSNTFLFGEGDPTVDAAVNNVYMATDSGDVYQKARMAGGLIDVDVCVGGTATSDSVYQSNDALYGAHKAFDDNTSSQWHSASTTYPIYIQYQFPEPQNIGKLRMRSISGFGDRMPRDFTLKASNTGAFSGEEIDVVSYADQIYESAVFKSFTFDPAGEFTYYRIHITAADDNYQNIAEIEMMHVDASGWELKREAKNTFLDLDDTPATYLGIEGNYFRATASGIEAVDGIILTASDQSEWVVRVTVSGVLYTEAV